MKSLNRFLILVLLCAVSSTSAHAEVLALFGQNDYEGWEYHRENVELTTHNISTGKISIFGDYTLSSPNIRCADYDTIRVSVLYVTPDVEYTASKIELSVALSDGNDVTMTNNVKAKGGMLEQTLVTDFCLSGIEECQILLAALKADIYNCASVKGVTVEGFKTSSQKFGDVNGDGLVNVTDVNCIINEIMGNGNYISSDINGDGIVNVSDVNALINLIMQ